MNAKNLAKLVAHTVGKISKNADRYFFENKMLFEFWIFFSRWDKFKKSEHGKEAARKMATLFLELFCFAFLCFVQAQFGKSLNFKSIILNMIIFRGWRVHVGSQQSYWNLQKLAQLSESRPTVHARIAFHDLLISRWRAHCLLSGNSSEWFLKEELSITKTFKQPSIGKSVTISVEWSN